MAEYEKLFTSLQNDVDNAYKAELIQKSDVLKVQLEHNKLKSNQLKLNNGINLMKMVLAQHIGIANYNTLAIQNTNIHITDPNLLYSEPQEAIKNRTEFAMLNKAIDAEILQKKMALGEYLPEVAVGATGMYMDMMENKPNNAMIFATVSIPLSDWWGGSHKLKEHAIKVSIAENNRTEKLKLLLLQINKTYNELAESYNQIAVAQSSYTQAQEYYNVVKDNYTAGIISTSDMLEAQAMLQQTLDECTDAKANYRIKHAYYLQAIGK